VWPAPDGLLAGGVQLVHRGAGQVPGLKGGEVCEPEPAYIKKHSTQM